MYSSRINELNKFLNLTNQINQEIDYINKYIYTTDKTKVFITIDYVQKEINKLINSVKELENPFTLVVIGCGNYGKSTVINALLKRIVVETKDIPSTWKVDLFIKSNSEKIEIVYNNDEKIVKSIKCGNEILTNEQIKYKNSKKQISELVQKYKKENKKNIKKIKDYKEFLEKEHLYKSNIKKVKYYLKKGNIIDDFVIVDTPGLNQKLLNQENKLNTYYEICDGIIWIIDAQNVVSSANYNLIDELNKIDNKYKSKDIIAVVNKIDVIDECDLQNVKKRCDELFLPLFKDVVYISAKEAIDAILNNNEVLINKSNIKQLYKSIEDNFKIHNEKRQIESKYKNAYITKNNIMQKIYEQKRQLYNDISIYKEISYELENECKNIKECTIKNLNQINKLNDVCKVKNNLKDIQQKCSSDFLKLYNLIYNKANINKGINYEKINTDVNFEKIKPPIQKPITKNKRLKHESILDVLYPNQKKEKNICINLESYKADVKKECEKILNNNIKLITSNIEYIKEDSFKRKYVEYTDIKEYIKFLNNIEEILNTLG